MLSPPVTLKAERLLQFTDELLARCDWPRERLLSLQRERLAVILRHAVDTSSYYRREIGAFVDDGAPLDAFPILTKRTLMENFDRIVTDTRLNRAYIERHLEGGDPGSLLLGEYRVAATGGTTGMKGLAVYDDAAWLAAIGNTLRFQKIVGIDENTHSVGVFASSPIHISYRIGAEMRALRGPAPRLNVLMPIEEVVEGLNLYQPEVISSYPSFIRVLAHEQLAGRLHIKPRLVRTSAETLTQEIRHLAAEAWGTVVANSYTCTEAGAMGHECERAQGLHLAEDAFVFEVVDEDNRPVRNGSVGAKLLVTTLTNRVLPLIRYEISDMVALATEPCPCGLPLWCIERIEGRREELLRFPRRGGGSVDVLAHRLRSPVTRIEGVSQFQFSQRADGLEVAIALVDGSEAEAVRHRIERAVRATLSEIDADPGDVTVRVVDQIERSGSGAKQHLVSRLPPEH